MRIKGVNILYVSCSFKANCKLRNIRVYLTGGEEKSSEKINTEIVHKRPNEEGKVPQSNESFCHHGRLTFHGYTIEMGQYSVQCELRPNLSDSSSAFVSAGCVNFRLQIP